MKNNLFQKIVIIVELVALLSLQLAFMPGSSFKWEVNDYVLSLSHVNGIKAEEVKKVNDEIRKYLDSFASYDDEFKHSYSYKVVSDTKNTSVVEITTDFLYMPSEEHTENDPAGTITSKLWVYRDGSHLETNWVETSNTLKVQAYLSNQIGI